MSKSKKQKAVPTKEQRQAADPHHSVWVAASAGSGKTQVLVDRVIRLLLDGATPDAILCLTFTKAAAAEMSNRLFQRLSAWIGLSDKDLEEELSLLGVTTVDVKVRNRARQLFARALETPGGLKIQTIHSFCERLLQLFPVESGMSPGFRVMDEQEARDLFQSTLLQSLASQDEKSKSVWAFLQSGDFISLEKLEELTKAFLSGSNGMRRHLSDKDAFSEAMAALRRLTGAEEITRSVKLLNEICDVDVLQYEQAITEIGQREADAQFKTAEVLRQVLSARDLQSRAEMLTHLAFQKNGKPRPNFLRADAKKQLPATHAWLVGEAARVEPLISRCSTQQFYESNSDIYEAMENLLAHVNLSKRNRGLYDFDDLISQTAKLLQSNEAAQWVLYKLDKGLTHILVDEAQDTSPAQWTIINALAGEFFTGNGDTAVKRTVFAVGDVKQSIYSFQGADISAFETARSTFAKILDSVKDLLVEVDLSISYRSNQQVLDVVDSVFASGRKARMGFGPRAEAEAIHTPYDKKRIGLVEIWDVEMPDEKPEQDNWRAPVDRTSKRHPRIKLADRIARTIKSWIGKRNVSGREKSVQPGDILILLQRRNDLFHALLGALRRHGVAVAGADRLKLQDSLIVQDMVMLGQFIRMPTDDHALACILKSPLVPEPLNEEQLFALAHDRDTTSLLQRLPSSSANAEWLQNLTSSDETPYQLFARVLRENRKLILERLGQEAKDAAEEFLTLALDYEQKHGTSLSAFLDWLSRGETEIKREMEADAGVVRLMTVHGAKGLEAPIVFLADAADMPRSKSDRLLKVTVEGPHRGLLLYEARTLVVPSIVEILKTAAKQESLEERSRLLYVAMTRAADELYVCGSMNKHDETSIPKESWYPQVYDAIVENLQLPNVRRIVTEDGFAITRFGADPVPSDNGSEVNALAPPLPSWATTTLPKTSAKQPPLLQSRSSDAFDKKAVEEGIAVHKLIEMMAAEPLNTREAEGERWAKRLKLDAALPRRLHIILQQPELAVFFGENAQSEVAIGGANGFVGRIDRMAMDGACIYLLDYKTDRRPPSNIGPDHRHARQMAVYAELLKAAFPDHQVKAALLWTQTGAIIWLSADTLSQALDQPP